VKNDARYVTIDGKLWRVELRIESWGRGKEYKLSEPGDRRRLIRRVCFAVPAGMKCRTHGETLEGHAEHPHTEET